MLNHAPDLSWRAGGWVAANADFSVEKLDLEQADRFLEVAGHVGLAARFLHHHGKYDTTDAFYS